MMEIEMGYNTIFIGQLKFKTEATASQLAALQSMFGEDCRDHPEWAAEHGLSYVDLRLTKDFSGIEWDDETEKTYNLDMIVNVVLAEMRKTWPDFGLTGSLSAQGEQADDRWALVMGDDGLAHRQKVALTGEVVTCPHCEKQFVLEAVTA